MVAVDVDVTRGRPELSEARWKFHNFPLDFVLGSESCFFRLLWKETKMEIGFDIFISMFQPAI